MDILTRQVRTKSKISWWRKLFRLILLVSVIVMSLAVALILYSLTEEPPPLQVAQSTRFYGADGSIIGEYSQGQKRYWLKLADISPYVIDATIAIEDRKFYRHLGFDFPRIVAAIITNIKTGSKAQGASTITQQYARNLYLDHDKTWSRKIREALYALRLEVNYEKEEILEGYLNTIYYGEGAYGIEAASRHYFNKSASDLTLAEASLLAGIPKGPSYYSPFANFELAKERQELILDAMVEERYITASQAKAAKEEPLFLATSNLKSQTTIGPYFQDAVKQELIEKYGLSEKLIESGGLEIYTTLDPKLQQLAEKIVAEEFANFDENLQTAFVAIHPKNGDVLALIGGRDYTKSPYNRATQAKRSPGSTIKPFLYYAALEHGFTPATTLLSEPTTFTYDEGRTKWSPTNFGNLYAYDFITMLQALAFSDNIFAVKTHLFLGTEELVKTAKRFGITSELENIPSQALGTSPVGVLELTKSYVPFANGGKTVEVRLVKKVVAANGEVLVDQKPVVKDELDPRYIFILNDIMSAMFDRSLPGYTTPTGSSIAHLITRPMSGKSGSTEVDSWMIGYTSQLVSGVWVGYDESEKLDHTRHGKIAKRIWANFMEQALQDQLILPFHKPDDVIGVYINPENGLLATDTCPHKRLTYFVKGTEPTEYCDVHSEEETNEPIKEEEHGKERFLDRFFKWIQ